MDLLDRLLDHDQWATTELLAICRELSDQQLDQSFDIGHRTIRETFDHLIVNIESWTALMVRIPPAEPPTDRSVAGLTARYERASSAFADLARRKLSADAFDETFPDFYEYPMTFGGGILHVILHNEGHRSEVVHMLNRLGIDADRLEVDHGLWDFKRRGL